MKKTDNFEKLCSAIEYYEEGVAYCSRSDHHESLKVVFRVGMLRRYYQLLFAYHRYTMDDLYDSSFIVSEDEYVKMTTYLIKKKLLPDCDDFLLSRLYGVFVVLLIYCEDYECIPEQVSVNEEEIAFIRKFIELEKVRLKSLSVKEAEL